MRRWTRAFATLVAIALLGAYSISASDASVRTGSLLHPQPTVDLWHAGSAAYQAHGSVGQVWLIDAAPNQPLELVAKNGLIVQQGPADAQGSKIFRAVLPASGYRVASGSGATLVASAPLTVTTPTNVPSHKFYASQHIGDGYDYLETRDGTTLSISVKLPGPIDKGPYPTVIEYSGYSPADPNSPQPSELIASALGYATVGINIRGTGCSGGAFDFFETLQSTDGYDAVETIAAQPWVAFHKVGMVGISYPGITQLFVAATNPPDLAAIAPLSVIDDTARGTLHPGGIFNDGFALSWAQDRQHDAQAAPASGQAWAGQRIENGDTVCAANQKLRSQAPDIITQIESNKYWTDKLAKPLAPEYFVDKITVPTFLSGAWQDEQVGGYWANLLSHFTHVQHAYFTGTNGSHTDPLEPAIFQRWYEFLSIYVAHKVPSIPAAAPLILNAIGSQVFGTNKLTLPPDRFAGVTSYARARQIYEGDPRVRILLDNGAGADPGVPVASSEIDAKAWPLPNTSPVAWYFGDGGALNAQKGTTPQSDTYRYDPSHDGATTVPDGAPDIAVWGTLPAWNWPAPTAGTALAYTTAPLGKELVMAGNASVDLWLQSTASDTDLQVTLTEVRPDGKETYVQNGWLRASDRALAPNATVLRPMHPFTQAAVQALPARKFVLARVEMFPFAHVFRAGSRIRLIIDAPGATRPRWKFDALPAIGTVTNSVGLGGPIASRIVLPVITGIVPPATPLPPCPSLRGQPCRDAATIVNAGP
jgi:uncharacterized protein